MLRHDTTLDRHAAVEDALDPRYDDDESRLWQSHLDPLTPRVKEPDYYISCTDTNRTSSRVVANVARIEL